MMMEVTASVAGDHPALAGHFPGRPVVPGALLLDMVIVVAEAKAQWRIAEVARMKFHRPLMAETEFSIRLRPIADGRVEVSCNVGEDPLISGVLRIEAGERRS